MKRSTKISLVLVSSISAMAVSGCSEAPERKPDTGGTFANKAECVAVYDAKTCEAAEKLALAEHQKNAPKSTREKCIEDYGANMCRPANDGSGMFMPLMVGYMLGNAMATPAPLYYGPGSYRERDRGYVPIYSSSPRYSGPVGQGNYTASTYSKPATATPTTKGSLKSTTAMTPPATQRGGFGSTFKPSTSFKSSYTASNPTPARSTYSTTSSTRSSTSTTRGGFGSSGRSFSAGG